MKYFKMLASSDSLLWWSVCVQWSNLLNSSVKTATGIGESVYQSAVTADGVCVVALINKLGLFEGTIITNSFSPAELISFFQLIVCQGAVFWQKALKTSLYNTCIAQKTDKRDS